MEVEKVKKNEHTSIFRVEKGWGHELWIENCPEYCGKLLFIKKNKKTSLHYHILKTETMYLQSGRVEITFVDSTNAEPYKIELLPGESLKIKSGVVHQIKGLRDSELFEFSTQHFDHDSFRIEKGD